MFCLLKVTVLLCLFGSTAKGQFDAFLDTDPDAQINDDSLHQKWALLESRIKTVAEEAVKIILSTATDVFSSMNISRSCFRESTKLFLGLRKLKTWAVKFIDATTKSADGLLNIQVPTLGSYDECVNNKVYFDRPKSMKGKLMFQGKYCNVRMRPYLKYDRSASVIKSNAKILENVYPSDSVFSEISELALYTYSSPMKAGLCVPSGCSKDDVNLMLEQVSGYLGVLMKASRCEIKEEAEYTAVMLAIITAYALLGFLVLVGTMVETYCHYFKKAYKSTGVHMLLAFSFISSFRKLTITPTNLKTSCLNGIRFLSMSWIILGHAYMYATFIHHNISRNFEDYKNDLTFQAVMNGFFGVDTFFFLSGFLVCYVTTNRVQIQKKPFSLKTYIIHRLWRLFPAYAAVIGYEIIKPLTGSGPLFHEVYLYDVEDCKNNWWTNFLFINNLYHRDKICVPHSWFIAVDTQLYLFALLIMLPLFRSPKLGISIAGASIIVSVVVTGVLTHKYNALAIFAFSGSHESLNTFHQYYNMSPYIHAPPFCIGLLLGYLLAVKSDFKVSKLLQALGWIVSITMCLVVVYGIQKWNMGLKPTVWENITYSAFSRTAWSLGIAWMTFCCCTGYGGVINYILSWKMWAPLSKLTYFAYLVHVTVMLAYNGNMRTIMYFQHYIIVWTFIGHLAIAYAVAFAGYTLVEAPFSSMETVLVHRAPIQCLPPSPQEFPGNEKDLEKNGVTKKHSSNAKIPETYTGVAMEGFAHI